MKKWERIIIYGFLGFAIIYGILQIRHNELKWKSQDEINRNFARSDSLSLEAYKSEAFQRLGTDSLIIDLNKEIIEKIRRLYGR